MKEMGIPSDKEIFESLDNDYGSSFFGGHLFERIGHLEVELVGSVV
jgi:hypothetical protein